MRKLEPIMAKLSVFMIKDMLEYSRACPFTHYLGLLS